MPSVGRPAGAEGGGRRTSSTPRGLRRARARGRGDEDEPPDEQGRHDRVVRVRARDVLREGVGGPGERKGRPEPQPAEAKPSTPMPTSASASQSSDVKCGRQVVPLVVVAHRHEAGNVGEVAERAVGVPAAVRHLAAAVRLDPLAHVAVGVGLAALLALVLGHVPVRRLAVLDDALCADDSARPTSITFDARRFSSKRKPARKTVAARSSHTGHSGRPEVPRPFQPIQAMRPRR